MQSSNSLNPVPYYGVIANVVKQSPEIRNTFKKIATPLRASQRRIFESRAILKKIAASLRAPQRRFFCMANTPLGHCQRSEASFCSGLVFREIAKLMLAGTIEISNLLANIHAIDEISVLGLS